MGSHTGIHFKQALAEVDRLIVENDQLRAALESVKGQFGPEALEADEMSDKISELNTALEKALAENMALREVLASFAFFTKPAAIELAGGDPDKIATVLLKHGNQSLSLGCFLMAREVWDEINLPDPSVKDTAPHWIEKQDLDREDRSVCQADHDPIEEIRSKLDCGCTCSEDDARELLSEIERLRAALGYFTAMDDPNTWKYGRETATKLAFQAMSGGSDCEAKKDG